MHLHGNRIGKGTALDPACFGTMLVMFKITQNTTHQFTLAEILLMVAMNEIEVKQRAAGRTEQACRNPSGVGQ
jgi:hypothetical protein